MHTRIIVMKINKNDKDGDCFTLGSVTYIYVGCDINGMDIYKLDKKVAHELAIVSTCRVTEEYRQVGIKALNDYIDKHPNAEVIITGCDAKVHPEYYSQYGRVMNKEELLSYFKLSDRGVESLPETSRLHNMVEVQRGCSHRCTYCFFPQAQGPTKSVAPSTIIDNCNKLIQKGITDIELVSTDACSYVYTENDIIIRYSDLLKLILKKCKGLTHLNIGQLDPGSSETEEVMTVIYGNPIFDQHIHLAVQSGSDSVLMRMGRRHKTGSVRKLHKYLPGLKYVWDIIVGFPGETEEEFNETFNFMKELKPEKVWVYKYNKQPNTVAATMDNQISDEVATQRKQKLEDLQVEIDKFYQETNKEMSDTLGETRTNDVKFIQYELWKDCSNGCPFCYNRNQPKELNKVGRMNYIMNLMRSDEVNSYNTMGFIGGELFNTELLNTTEQDVFTQLMSLSADLVKQGKIDRVYITSNLIYADTSLLVRVLNMLNSKGVINHYCLCTSWDYKYRFKTENDKRLWERNMLFVKNTYPTLMLHVETIITQVLIDAVMSGELDLSMFEKKYGASVDYMAPNAGYNYSSKQEFEKEIPGFFPKRSSFLDFLTKTTLEDRTINLKTLFKRELQCDCIYWVLNGKPYKVTNRVTTAVPFPCDIPRIAGYIDSDVFMKNDVKEFRDMVM